MRTQGRRCLFALQARLNVVAQADSVPVLNHRMISKGHLSGNLARGDASLLREPRARARSRLQAAPWTSKST